MTENFTFVVCSHTGHSVENRFFNRVEADVHFNQLVGLMQGNPNGMFVAYYCASVGGLVNASFGA